VSAGGETGAPPTASTGAAVGPGLTGDAMVPRADRRGRAARGAVINSIFFAALGGLGLLRSFIVAAFLSASAFGVWSVLFLAVILIGAVKAVVVVDKYVQQDDPDQEAAFQRAFTLELISAGVLAAAMLALAPLLTLIYGDRELLLPGLALALLLPGLALQFPISVWYRRMRYLRQRLLMSVDPITGFVVTVALAAAGLSYWSLVIGVVVGAWAGGLVALAASPYRIALRYERAALRQYASFSAPLVVAVVSGLMIGQLSLYFGNLVLGLAGAGAIGLAATYTAYTDRIDAIVTHALYPALCRVAERRDLLLEAFVKSNRLALMWGMPFGVGLTLFAADLIEFGIGSQWEEALIVLQVFGIAAAVNHIGFNWGAFFKARGETRPMAKTAALALVTFATTALPLMLAFGLTGYAVSMSIVTVVGLVARFYFLGKLFPAFRLAFHIARAIAPTVPAVAAVLLIRVADGGARSLEVALGELGVYVLVTVAATIAFERALLGEALSYVRRRPSVQPG
jgi:O-antigen/teichoic acid export membrane protein